MTKPATELSGEIARLRNATNLPEEVRRLVKETDARLRQLDAEGWLRESTSFYRLSAYHDLRLHSADPNILVYTNAGGVDICQIGEPAVRVGTRTPAVASEAMVPTNHQSRRTDATILAEFECVLKSIREHVAPPVVKRGKPAAERQLRQGDGVQDLAGTKYRHVSPLDRRRATLGLKEAKTYPDYKLGELLGFYKEPRKRTNKAKKALMAALARLPALATQVAHSKTAADQAQKLIAARIARVILRRN